MKKLLVGCLSLLAVSMFAIQARATMLSFTPSASSINIGENLDVDVVISDLGGSFVGAFDFDVTFDDTILTFNSYSFTDNLGDISAGDADDWSFGDLGFGTVNLAELSWLLDLSFQGDSFTLATLSFTGSAVGTSGLGFGLANISDDWGNPIAVTLGAGTVDVAGGAPVPEPATMILFGTGIAGLLGSGIRKKRAYKKLQF